MSEQERIDRFYEFCVNPADDGVNEPCRVVVHDKVADEFCAFQELEPGASWTGSLRDLSQNSFCLKVNVQQTLGSRLGMGFRCV
ncbi:hypothetical protein SAMN05421538_105208 [Paracoccus isoporae]|uniref:Uncharacterized protein n=1 Tax=Paracoccus isoporae TaxID=591205 RepID=A0A1G7BU30_9RHOB|nr:hypothetical protein [Paracoccus isoporae]SDE30644.1 hypothetical protein SAMN05421538_105208 [Paracoccus isoporae]